MSRLSKKRREEAKNLLNATHFNQGRKPGPERADPLIPSHIKLTLDELKCYDRNPRQAPNSAYEAILEDLRPRGFEGALAVTRRPGEEQYMPRRGGNTCLRALRQLWEETGDEKYRVVDCLFVPWTTEADVLAAHLSENDNRGDVIFIDRARGVMELKRQLEEKKGAPLSARKLAAALREIGYSVTFSTVAAMEYAVTILLPLIPTPLGAGMGKPQIEATRKLHNAFREVFAAQGEDPDRFDALLSTVLPEHDDLAWDLDAVRSALARKSAELLDLPVTQVHAGLELIFAGREAVKMPGRPPEPEQDPEPAPAPDDKRAASPTMATPSPARSSRPQEVKPALAAGNDAPAEPAPPPARSATETGPPPATVEALRRRNAQLAEAMVQGTLIAPCFRAIGVGYGFFIDVPYATTNPLAHEEEQQEEVVRDRWLWWLLATLSEVVFDPSKIRMMDEEVEARRWLVGGGAKYYEDRLLEQATKPDWYRLGRDFLSHPDYLDDERLEALLELIRNDHIIHMADSGEPDIQERVAAALGQAGREGGYREATEIGTGLIIENLVFVQTHRIPS